MTPLDGPIFEVENEQIQDDSEASEWIDTDRIDTQRADDRRSLTEMEANDPDKAIDEAYQRYIEDAWDWADMSYEEFKEWHQWWADNWVDMETEYNRGLGEWVDRDWDGFAEHMLYDEDWTLLEKRREAPNTEWEDPGPEYSNPQTETTGSSVETETGWEDPSNPETTTTERNE